jgi:hypothetical protein
MKDDLSMGRFDKPSDPRSPARPRQSGDNVPLIPLRRELRRGSRNRNSWNDDTEEETFSHETRRALLAEKSSDSFRGFLEEEDEDTDRLLDANGWDEAAVDIEQTESDMELEDEAKLLMDDSPHEEVRAAVSNTDDSSMACVRLCLFQIDCIGDVSSLGDGQSVCDYWLWSQHSILHACSFNLSVDTYRPARSLPLRESVGKVHA